MWKSVKKDVVEEQKQKKKKKLLEMEDYICYVLRIKRRALKLCFEKKKRRRQRNRTGSSTTYQKIERYNNGTIFIPGDSEMDFAELDV